MYRAKKSEIKIPNAAMAPYFEFSTLQPAVYECKRAE